jgi:hypothetical protein
MAVMFYRAGTEVKVNNLWPCDLMADDDDDAEPPEGWFRTALEAHIAGGGKEPDLIGMEKAKIKALNERRNTEILEGGEVSELTPLIDRAKVTLEKLQAKAEAPKK